ncbi:MAG: hypothetical protein AB8G86_09520 [Saprospiraceae bacterium]
MPYLLKNKQLEIHIDHPLEQYQATRFDWTGKISVVNFQNMPLSGIERTDGQNESALGKGFYNEFGIDTALGFDATPIGGWFHKIGIGLLKKTDDTYAFHKSYDIQPATFTIKEASNQLIIVCQSALVNGYAYTLRKSIELKKNSFIIHYYLENTGEKVIITDEYVHNFTAINQALISANYALNFPFHLKPALFEETVNPEKKVILEPKSIQFSGTPTKPFFFSNLSGNEKVAASWELVNQQHKIGIRESGNFQTDKVNLWGWKHVISPELFFKINLTPNQSTEWIRQYDVYQIE